MKSTREHIWRLVWLIGCLARRQAARSSSKMADPSGSDSEDEQRPTSEEA